MQSDPEPHRTPKWLPLSDLGAGLGFGRFFGHGPLSSPSCLR